ncbi:hypothetical protein NliqN6_1223 [Naganishia liquefaciens]|uniref:Uncharacterized protein n=1 Tax=Naganishia liquefaciens TaxID=104408 RepID=A0A8H3YEJ4_9TREE|nr:hypothetical protein NliqN6_1223 [Naganishia liquefaciens]
MRRTLRSSAFSRIPSGFGERGDESSNHTLTEVLSKAWTSIFRGTSQYSSRQDSIYGALSTRKQSSVVGPLPFEQDAPRIGPGNSKAKNLGRLETSASHVQDPQPLQNGQGTPYKPGTGWTQYWQKVYGGPLPGCTVPRKPLPIEVQTYRPDYHVDDFGPEYAERPLEKDYPFLKKLNEKPLAPPLSSWDDAQSYIGSFGETEILWKSGNSPRLTTSSLVDDWALDSEGDSDPLALPQSLRSQIRKTSNDPAQIISGLSSDSYRYSQIGGAHSDGTIHSSYQELKAKPVQAVRARMINLPPSESGENVLADSKKDQYQEFSRSVASGLPLRDPILELLGTEGHFEFGYDYDNPHLDDPLVIAAAAEAGRALAKQFDKWQPSLLDTNFSSFRASPSEFVKEEQSNRYKPVKISWDPALSSPHGHPKFCERAPSSHKIQRSRRRRLKR